MSDEIYKTEFIDECRQRLKSFTMGFIGYIKEAEDIYKALQEFFDDLQLELFIWSCKPENKVEASLLDDEIFPTQITTEQTKRINVGENEDIECGIKNYIKKTEEYQYIFSSVSEISNYKSGEIIGKICVMWGIVLVTERRVSEKIVAEVLVDFLEKRFYGFKYINMADALVWKNNEEKFSFNIINEYVKKVFDKFETKILPENVMRKTSFQHYEKSEVNATVYFVDKEIYNRLRKREKEEEENNLVWIEEEKNSLKNMGDEKNVPILRKMLETCRNGNVLLIMVRDKKIQIVAVANEQISKDEQLYYKLQFVGFGSWRFSFGEESILEYNEGMYSINSQHFDSQIANKVSKIKLIVKGKESAFIKIFEVLFKCSHGALMIVGTGGHINNEVKRLSKYGKGTMIQEFDLSDIESNDEKQKLIRGLASIDGAIMMDYNCICYGFGFILDGKTEIEGEVGRGSRFNSAINYSKLHNLCAVVFSEDKEKDIDVIIMGKLCT